MLSVEFVRIDELLKKKKTNFLWQLTFFILLWPPVSRTECSRANGERLMGCSSPFAPITKTLGMSHIA